MNDPRPFAIMRLTHDAFRQGLAEVAAALGQLTNGDAPLRAALDPLREALAVHRVQEESSFFPLLDERFDGVIAAAGLRDEHVKDLEDLAAVDALLDGYEPTRAPELERVLGVWMQEMDAHLVREEDIMMPLTMKTSDTTEGRAALVRDIVDVDLDGFLKVQVPYVTQRLADGPFAPKLPAYIRALGTVLSSEELQAAGVEAAG